jgi:diaminobutyrate-2-oxoglutarate transaminase
LEKMLSDPSSGLDPPAAIIVETIQGEGGVNVASAPWLERMFHLARRYGALLIVDDIQVGCGRAGTFFSFEGIRIEPDIVCLSKSIGAMGMPMSIVLLRPNIDVWQPGQHNGTFRGNDLAFVAATAALDHYWRDGSLERHMAATTTRLDGLLGSLGDRCGLDLTCRGRGLIRGIQWTDATKAKAVSRACFQLGLIVETCGPLGNVLKLLPPLNTSPQDLERGVELLAEAACLVARDSGLDAAN